MVKIILDTDMSTDVDDAGALAVLHALADNGEAEILAVMHNTGHPLGVPVIDIINRFYGRPSLPVGALKTDFDNEDARPYLTALVETFPAELTRDSVPDATRLYRQILALQPDSSVVIVSIGFVTNLRALLESGPDEFSPLYGTELVRQKVKELVVQGGAYPASERPTWNFAHAGAVPYTQFISQNWPAPITFLGYEIGIGIKTGADFEHLPDENPLKLAYYNFFDNHFGARESWDQVCVLYGVSGLGQLFTRIKGGTNCVLEDGNNHWDEEWENQYHSYLKQTAGDGELAEIIEELMIQQPPAQN